MQQAMIAILSVALVAPALAQGPAGHIAAGIKAEEAMNPAEALGHFQEALAADSANYEANWRAAIAAVQVAQLTTPPTMGQYKLAEQYARRASAIDQTNVQSHFVIAYALGARSLVSGSMQRLGLAREIWQEASNAILLDAKHDGAYHVLGEWYAQIMRLSMFERGFANGSLGDIAKNATWDLAMENLEKAVQLKPKFIYHRLDLARTYHDVGRDKDARAQLLALDTLPPMFALDPKYKADAKALLAKLAATP